MRPVDSLIRAGLRRLSTLFRASQAGYLASRQADDGGWPGRRGASDLYYTSFALRAADALIPGDGELWRRAARFLSVAAPRASDIIEWAAFLESADILSRDGFPLASREKGTPPRVACEFLLDSLRAEGGYSRAPGGQASTYMTFLASLCLEFLGRGIPDCGKVAGHLRSRQQADGGFVESRRDGSSGVNPTAAAVSVLITMGQLDRDAARSAADFLLAAQRPDGGFAAHAEAPCSDLLSTFTALSTLVSLGALHEASLAGAGRFARGLAVSGGGFRGSPDDDEPDVEYTYYGLAAVGILSAATERKPGAGCPCREAAFPARP